MSRRNHGEPVGPLIPVHSSDIVDGFPTTTNVAPVASRLIQENCRAESVFGRVLLFFIMIIIVIILFCPRFFSRYFFVPRLTVYARECHDSRAQIIIITKSDFMTFFFLEGKLFLCVWIDRRRSKQQNILFG